MSIGTDDLGRITQETDVLAADGDRLGSVHQVYTSDTTGDPAWVTVKTGLFGSQESFVPLADASFEGGDIRVGVTKDAVHGAPRVDSDGHLSPEEEDALYRHYGLHDPDQADAAGTVPAPDDRTDADRDDADRVDDRQDVRTDDRDDDRGDAVVGAGAGAATGAALGGGVAGRDRSGPPDSTDAGGTAETVEAAPRHADLDDRSVAAENGPEHVDQAAAGRGDPDAVKPGERTTRLRRYVVTERVVQTIEELPDEDDTSR